MRTVVSVAAAIAVAFAAGVPAQEKAQENAEPKAHGSAIAASPQWEKVKSLAGEWVGYVVADGKKYEGSLSIRITADNSAVMHWMDQGTPHEMITMFHMDRDNLMATHYCAAHNQPRMVAVAGGDPNRVAFDFKDGTNIRPGDVHMRKVALVFVDADHHDEEWTSDQNGTLYSAVFHYERKK